MTIPTWIILECMPVYTLLLDGIYGLLPELTAQAAGKLLYAVSPKRANLVVPLFAVFLSNLLCVVNTHAQVLLTFVRGADAVLREGTGQHVQNARKCLRSGRPKRSRTRRAVVGGDRIQR